ncbi:MAG: hypothetical protein IKB73_04930 [Ruminococcus sp.]|nr:hypothetical protein [Ruminococcus sp.]
MANYSLHTQSLYGIGRKKQVSYGIIVTENGETSTIADISIDKIAVEQLIERLNTYELSTEHLSQVIEDFLCDHSA